MTDDLFNRALGFVLKWEGGFVDNPDDLGGRTNKGITQSTYNAYLRNKGLANKDVKLISDNEVKDIYYNNYWLAAGCDRMTDIFAAACFDTAVNMGVSRVDEFLRAAGWQDLDKFLEARRNKYKEFAKYGNQKIFLQGWLNRLNALEDFLKTL